VFEHDASTHNTTAELFLPFKFIERFDLDFRVDPPFLTVKVSDVAALVRCDNQRRHVNWYL